MSSLQHRVKQMQQEIMTSSSSEDGAVPKSRNTFTFGSTQKRSSGTITYTEARKNSGASSKPRFKNVRSSRKNTKQNYPRPLNLHSLNGGDNDNAEKDIFPRSNCYDRVIPVTPDAESGFQVDHSSRKVFYQNIQERLVSVNMILDQYEVSSSSSEDENVPVEAIETKVEEFASNDSEVRSASSSRNSSMHHPYYQLVQTTVASLCGNEHDDDDDGGEESINSRSSLSLAHSVSFKSRTKNRKKVTECQNPYYQSVQNLGGDENALNTGSLPVKAIIYGHPESIKSTNRQRDDLTTLTASETATILSGGTDVQIPYSKNVARIMEDGSLGSSLPPRSSDMVPDTPDFSLASDEAVMGSLYGHTFHAKNTQSSPNFPRKISFQNENMEAGYTSLKDLVQNETLEEKRTSGVSHPPIVVEDNVQRLKENDDSMNQVVIQINEHDNTVPTTPAISKLDASKHVDLDLVATPMQFREDLISPFKAVSKEGNEISRVKESDEYDDCDSSLQSNCNGMDVSTWNEIDIQALSSLNLFKKKRSASQECACIIM